MFHYIVVFLDGTQKEIIANEWHLSNDCEWFVFYIENQEICRINGDEIRMMERKPI